MTASLNVAIPLFPRFTALDAVGPYEVLQRIPFIDVVFVGSERGEYRTENGMLAMVVDTTYEELAEPDVIVFPGGVGSRPLQHDEQVLEWVRHAHASTRLTTSVCTGSLVLGAAGLLTQLTATTHWSCYPELAAHGALPIPERVVEHLGQRLITAAVRSTSSSINRRAMSIPLETPAAEAAQLMIEYDPQPPFDSGALAKASEVVVTRVVEYAALRS
jgi:putative intracellular protease/amidase